MTAAPELLHLLRQKGIDYQLQPEETAHRIEGEVVAGRPETAGDEDGVGGAERVAQRGGDFRRMISGRQFQHRTKSGGGETAAEKSRVGVENGSFQKFSSGG